LIKLKGKIRDMVEGDHSLCRIVFRLARHVVICNTKHDQQKYTEIINILAPLAVKMQLFAIKWIDSYVVTCRNGHRIGRLLGPFYKSVSDGCDACKMIWPALSLIQSFATWASGCGPYTLDDIYDMVMKMIK
jgi:hypothetical protein